MLVLQLRPADHYTTVVNRPFPIRAKYAWNACVGVLLCLDGLGDSTGVRDDYVMAGVYTRIYMALMGNVYSFDVYVALSAYWTTAWPC